MIKLFYSKKLTDDCEIKIKYLCGLIKVKKAQRTNKLIHIKILFFIKINFPNYCYSKNLDKLKNADEVFILRFNCSIPNNKDCLYKYIDAIKLLQKPIIIHCDNYIYKELLNNLMTKNNNLFAIKTNYKKFEKISKNLVNPEWKTHCITLLQQFYMTKKLNIKSFWTIDADDTFWYCKDTTLAEIFKKAKKYADEQKYDCFSYDMHYSKNKYFVDVAHWSFGVTYIRNNKHDYFNMLKNQDVNFYKQYDFERFNIDTLFTHYHTLGILNNQTFGVKNILFSHLKILRPESHIYYHNDKYQIFCDYLCMFDEKQLSAPLDENVYLIDVGQKDLSESKEIVEEKYLKYKENLNIIFKKNNKK